MFEENIYILNNLCEALLKKKNSKIIYVSSDAVFSDSKKRINEKSLKNPDSCMVLCIFIEKEFLASISKICL